MLKAGKSPWCNNRRSPSFNGNLVTSLQGFTISGLTAGLHTNVKFLPQEFGNFAWPGLINNAPHYTEVFIHWM